MKIVFDFCETVFYRRDIDFKAGGLGDNFITQVSRRTFNINYL